MSCDYKIKYAAIVAFSLAGFSFSQAVLALGLGDINVYSSLGEPLKASITVLGAQDLKSESCLSLGPDSDLKKVDFSLGPVTNGTARLDITNNTILNEPIINLSLIAGCESSIQRHYVLLLDPPLSNTASNNTNNQRAEAAIAPMKKTERRITQAEPAPIKQSIQQPVTSSSKKKKANNKKVAPKRKQSKTVAQQSNSPTKSNQLPPKKPDNNDGGAATNSQPRLSISGGSQLPSFNETGLRLEKTLNLSPNAYPPISPEDIMIDDELTVVNNRIAHLQNQISELQAQNLKLSSDNQLKSQQLTQTKSQKTTFNMLLFIVAILLLVLAYIVFNWLRRRQLENQDSSTQSIRAVANKKQDVQEQLATKDETISQPITEKTKAPDTSDSPPSMPLISTFKSSDPDDTEQPILIEDDQAFSVLDHADVFLFHGRANLAIQLLQDYLLEHPKQSVTIWLFLLDLLAKENLNTLYEEVAADCKLHFNVSIPEFSQPNSDTFESLEDFPRLAQGLTKVWNTPSALIYLDDLIYNNRLDPRSGLPKSLIEELVLLKNIAQENVDPADAPQLDQKKLAEIKEKEALLESRKNEKLKEIAEAQKLAKEKEEAEKNETSFDFTLADK